MQLSCVVWHRLPDEIAVKLLAEAGVIWKLDWGWRINFKEASFPWLSIGSLILALWASPLGCLGILKTWQLAFPRMSEPRQKEREWPRWKSQCLFVNQPINSLTDGIYFLSFCMWAGLSDTSDGQDKVGVFLFLLVFTVVLSLWILMLCFSVLLSPLLIALFNKIRNPLLTHLMLFVLCSTLSDVEMTNLFPFCLHLSGIFYSFFCFQPFWITLL